MSIILYDVELLFFKVSRYVAKPSMSLTSRPTRPKSIRQKRRLGVIFTPSRQRAKRRVHSLPRLSKSNRRITSRLSIRSISLRTSRKDFPEVFAKIMSPVIPAYRGLGHHFFLLQLLECLWRIVFLVFLRVYGFFLVFSLFLLTILLPSYFYLQHFF